MIGDGLHRLARGMLRPETCRTIVEPAIADLQHEAPQGHFWRARAYVAVYRAVAAAVLAEIAGDCAATVRQASLGSMALPVAATAGLALLFQVPFILSIASSPRAWHHDVVLVALHAPVMVAFIAPAVALPLAAVLARPGHEGARRAAFIVSAVLTILVVLGSARAAVALQPLRRDLFFAAAWSYRDGQPNRPLWVARDLYRTRLEELRAGEPLRPLGLSHRDAALAFTCLTFAVVGITFARRSQLILPLLAGLVLLAHIAMGLTFTRVLYVQAVTGWASAIWAPAMLAFLVFAWIAVRVPEPRA
jgi:hypothetical protein